ncbi:hypothetical protein MGG_17301 [Pyricularia oryzae 70-15]|uniref:Host transcription reprogramming factor 10 n=2 Tax=Pyricularia oryzae TaxID=318829 RepID=HTR10_PYRO7|nr:uncharacterized protein MGG_17301 [Pyricularia oryzae 70-15]G4NBL6.1 RecName: Full=Host transcription reprogramming factor 10; AltName: Full=Secreted nuclear effector HTR10; Flags: Precursor [Pyricularia oryzae 70-15]EHA48121.1 hypothetical protein MGG_17301 [Pyricularia oryzae 70-15]
MQIFNMVSLVALFALGATAVPVSSITGVQCCQANHGDLTTPQAQSLFKSHQKRQDYWVCHACNKQFTTPAALQKHKDTVVHP